MSFLAVRKEDLTDNEDKFQRHENQIFYSPLPQIIDSNYPTIWLDLHVSEEGYEICGEDKKLEFKRSGKGQTVSIPPRFSVRFTTQEKIGISSSLSAIVVNSAGNAVKGLFIAPGKIDPGFSPNKLTLVVTNNSRKAIYIKGGAKIATIAFVVTSLECTATRSIGWAERKIDFQYSPGRVERIINYLGSFDYKKIIGELIMVILTTLIILYLTGLFKVPGA